MSFNPARSLGALDDDDYVAQVLAREARDSSLKYSAQGLEAYMPRRPTGAAPKPNTRFLRHIIKETDSHNAALKRKEEREARERMRQLRNPASASTHESSREHRRRRDYPSDHRALIGGNTGVVRGLRNVIARAATGGGTRMMTPKSAAMIIPEEVVDIDHPRGPGVDPHASTETQAPEVVAKATVRVVTRRHVPVPGPTKGLISAQIQTVRGGFTRRTMIPSDSESDPLEDLVGPLPPKQDGSKESAPIRSRGRGAYKPNMSNIDAHFAPDYDPATDMQLEEDDLQSGNKNSRRHVAGLMTGDDDWDYALEALRDRARWKQKGEERLREAGFSTDFVERWKNNTTSKPEDDTDGRLESVKWTKKGEGREWDRGKYVDEDGHIDVKASW
ncbi:hypothetical protein BO99DRAFT_393908 [Aspergillus violaceofuscus CBS 115571]|uniref:Uncharacterized protein n=1 Tax=Aspergillus violaceofuscus (strain CBS 115571) TaxID=1450538 RepID=A0A2V5GU46_ASPV1|nr:hypothetical protein BO99DRAFT_393908 [Aspergillus violaceofuscus CBS 115571]